MYGEVLLRSQYRELAGCLRDELGRILGKNSTECASKMRNSVVVPRSCQHASIGGSMSTTNPILVTGAAGRIGGVGRRVVELKASRSRPGRGIATLRSETRNQLGETVPVLIVPSRKLPSER